eukprot:UN23993
MAHTESGTVSIYPINKCRNSLVSFSLLSSTIVFQDTLAPFKRPRAFRDGCSYTYNSKAQSSKSCTMN